MSTGDVHVLSDDEQFIIDYATDGVPRRIGQVCGLALEALRARGATTVHAMAAARACRGILGN